MFLAMTIKKKIQTKYRLPVLNWTPMKPQQVKGTVFADLDDEKLYRVRSFLILQYSELWIKQTPGYNEQNLYPCPKVVIEIGCGNWLEKSTID